MNATVRWILALLAAAGLAVDAYTHLDLAHSFDLNTTGTVDEGVLFRLEAGAAVVAALALLVRRNLLTAALAVLVSGGGAFVLLLYRYVDLGKLGPVPDMYEPAWYGEKVLALVGELVALAASLALLATVLAARRHREDGSRKSERAGRRAVVT